MTRITRKSTALAVVVALSGLASGANAGGFGIATQSGSGTGNAFAGGAAVADDASVAWSNPAGMTFLPSGKQLTGALHALRPSFKFQNRGSSGAFAAPGSGEGGNGGDWAFVPNAFFTMDIRPNWRFGVALNVPFGLTTDYDNGWRGQLTALKSQIKTVNINPSAAYKVSDMVSVGGGLNVQKMEAELTSFAGAAGNAMLTADDVGYGFNVGIMAQTTPDTRIGATYRSKIRYKLKGTANFSGVAALNGGIQADLQVPDSFSFSVFHDLNSKWEVMGDVTWTGWSSVQQLAVIRSTASAGGGAGSALSTLPFQWRDTWRFSIGANYKLNDQTKIRLGLALDETPTNNLNRTPRLPDQNRTWLAFGVQHRVSNASVLDVGYAREFVRDATVNTTAAPLTCPPHCLTGSFENKAHIFSLQYSHSF